MKLTITLMFFVLFFWLNEARRLLDLVEGDMLLSKDQVEAHNQVKNGRVRRAAIRQHLWRKGIVYYTLAENLSQKMQERAKEAMKHWMDKTCLKFKERSIEKYYVTFLSDPFEGCASYVGFQREAKQPIFIGSTAIPCNLGSVIHEIGHAIGFFHEHNRPDRDQFVKFDENNLTPAAKAVIWNWEIKNDTDSRGFDYDYDSIMHYSRTQGSKNGPNKPYVLDPKKKDVEIGFRDKLSKGDIAQAKEMYQCNDKGESELDYDPSLDDESDKASGVKPKLYQ